MIEIISIFIQLITFLIIFSFPFNPVLLNKYFKLKKQNFKIIDSHALNIIFFIYVCLIFSFLNINLENFLRVYLVISLINLIFNYKKFYSNFKDSNKILFFIFLIILISVFFYIAQNLKLEWDGANHWLEKVLIFYNGNPIEDLKNVQIHPYYPHLGSYLWALFWKNSFLQLEYFGRFFYVYFYIVSIFLILEAFNVKNVFKKILIILFFVALTFEPYLFAGYQEYLIFSTLIIASKYISIIDFKSLKNVKLFFLILIILYLICWFKDEGTFYFIIFSFFLILFSKISPSSRLLLYSSVILLLITQYILQKHIIGIYDFPQYQKTTIDFIISDIYNYKILISKLSKIIFHILISFIKYPLWIVVFTSIFIGFIIKNRISLNEKYYYTCLIFNLIFIITIFFTFRAFDFTLKTSIDRLLFQTSGFYLILISTTINKLKIFKK